MTAERRWYTVREIKAAREYAEEGLSIGRAARLLGRSRNSLAGAALRNGITFHGESGPPFGNTNRLGTGKKITTREERLRRLRARMKRYRERLRAGKVRHLKKEPHNIYARRQRRLHKLDKWKGSADD